ncbi:hypothetical protein D3C72_1440650 [compost metagenome]
MAIRELIQPLGLFKCEVAHVDHVDVPGPFGVVGSLEGGGHEALHGEFLAVGEFGVKLAFDWVVSALWLRLVPEMPVRWPHAIFFLFFRFCPELNVSRILDTSLLVEGRFLGDHVILAFLYLYRSLAWGVQA